MGSGTLTTLTLRLPDELKAKLDNLAEATERSRSWLAQAAIREYIRLNEWQISETRDGVREADAGDFASEEEVRAVRNKWSGSDES